MRITNTMLKQASLSSGLPLTHSSLLDHLNNDSNDLMTNAIKSRNQMMKTSGYGNLKKAAEKLMENSDKAAGDSWYDSLRETAEEKIAKAAAAEAEAEVGTTGVIETADAVNTDGKVGADEASGAAEAGEAAGTSSIKTTLDADTRKEAASVIERIVSAYNDTSKALLKDANTINQFYRQELSKAVSSGVKDLGLSVSKSGTLTFDADKLKKDITVSELQDKLQPIARKLAFISEHVADNASANLNSVSTQYGASGKSYYNAGNRYDYRG